MAFAFTIYVTRTRASVPVVVWACRLSANCSAIPRRQLLRDMRTVAMIRCVAVLKASAGGLQLLSMGKRRAQWCG
jgi:hypothetical protein